MKKLWTILLAALLLWTAASAGAETFDEKHEILIIGGGASGLSAAVEAADLGAKDVLLVEKLGYVGGSAFVSAGILGGFETQVSKALDLHIDPMDMYNEQMAEKDYTLDPALTMTTTMKSGETIDWLIDRVGVPFQKDIVVKDGYGTFQTIHLVEGGGAGMRAPFDETIKGLEAVKVELNTPATELICEDGKVVGAVIQREGKPVRVGAQAVILATGGYSSNRELFTRLHPANAVFQSGMMPGCTGDGLVMAMNIGAIGQNVDQIQVYLREYDDVAAQTPYMYTLFVGLDGQRFMDEKSTAQTYNQAIRDDIIDLYGRQGADYFYCINDHAAMEQFGLAEDAKNKPGVVIADTLDELAEKTGMDAEGLKAAVEKWNTECVAQQQDTEFGRTQFFLPVAQGPFYALKTTFFASVCHGGLAKNENAQPIRADGTPIEGLYTSGEVTATTNSNGYTISAAVTWGRIAAENAVASLKK